MCSDVVQFCPKQLHVYPHRVSDANTIMLNGITEVLVLLRGPHVHDEMTLVLRPGIRNPTGFLTQSQHLVLVFLFYYLVRAVFHVAIKLLCTLYLAGSQSRKQ